MGKVLVKSYEFQIGPDGKPQMYYNITGRGRSNSGSDFAGRTFRDRAGSFVGGTAGLLTSLAGESRSFGGALGQAIAGVQQGSYFGRGLARRTPGNRRAQARADILEGEKQARIRSDAEAQLRGEREMKRRRGLDRRELSLEQIRDMGPSPNRRRILPGIGRRNMTQFGHELAAYQTEQEAIAAEQAKREQKQRDAMEAAGLKPNIEALQRIEQINNPELLDAALAAGHVRGLTLGEMAQQPQVPQQVQQAAGFNQTDKTVNEELNGPQAVQTHVPRQVENAEDEVREMRGGNDEEELPTDNQRLQQFMERIGLPGGGQ